MSIHGSMFNVNDVENAADNPFDLNVGRNKIVISESGPDTIPLDGEDKAVWKVVLRDPEDAPDSFRRQDVLFFLDGDAKQRAQTDSNIKRMLKGLEVPVSQWEGIAADPKKLVGRAGIVDLARSKKGRLFVKDWYAAGKGTVSASTVAAASNKEAASKIYDL